MGGQKADVSLLSSVQYSTTTPRGQVTGHWCPFFELFAGALEHFVRCFIFYVYLTSFWQLSQHSSDAFWTYFSFFFFLESVLSAGTGLGTALPLSYLEMNFKGKKGKERKELHLTSWDKVKGSIIIFLFLA